MLSFLSESQDVAVATAPLPTQVARPKLQPLAGMGDAPAATVTAKLAPNPLPSVPVPKAHVSVQTVKPEVRTMVFTAEGRPPSPWAGGTARIAAKTAAPTGTFMGTPAAVPGAEDGIEGVRKLIMGRQMGDVKTKIAELQMSLNGEVRRVREVLMNRVDEMAGLLHRDMVVLREETRAELAQLKTDLFTAATGLSSLRDRLSTVENRRSEDTAAAIAEIEMRMHRQEGAFTTALDNIEHKMMATMESKCADAFAVLARKSDLAAMLQKLGALVEQDKPLDSGWISTTPTARQTTEGSTWAELAAGPRVNDSSVDDWQCMKPFMADDSPAK